MLWAVPQQIFADEQKDYLHIRDLDVARLFVPKISADQETKSDIY